MDETEVEKLTRIKREREKAAQAYEESQKSKANLGYFEGREFAARKGHFVRDREAIRRSAESFANFGLICAIGGMFFALILRGVPGLGDGGTILTSAITTILSGVGILPTIIAAVFAVVDLVKYHEHGSLLVTSLVTVAIYAGYFALMYS